jgi:hypothetical protein
MRLHDAMEQGCNGFRSVLRRTPGGPHLPPAPSSPTLWERRGEDDAPHLPPSPLSTPTLRERKGERSGAGAMLRGHLSTMPSPPPRSPLSRSAGEGPGVRVARSAGEGPGVRATPHLVPLSYTAQKYVGPPHAMIARVRDTPNERSAFSIRR